MIRSNKLTHTDMSTNRLLLIIGWITITFTTAAAQEVLDRLISVQTTNETIASVLSGIEDRYRIFFTYSKNYIPVEKKVSLYHARSPLRRVLEDMFESTAVVYVEKRGKVILKIDPVKEEELRQLSLYEEIRKRQEAIISARREENERLRLSPMVRQTKRYLDRPGGYASLEVDWEKYKFPPLPPKEPEPELEPFPDRGPERKLAQASIFPFFGTNGLESNDITNRLSFNLFWGMNGGVDGLEAGLFFNSIRNKVEGVQIAGMGNTVGGDLEGVQAAGLFNVVLGNVEGVQAAGLFNVTPARFSGVQLAGMFNIAAANESAVQVAGLMNASTGNVKTQISGLFNAANHVNGGQFSSLLNVAKRVEGVQLGLINVADSISGVPIGLLNFIKNGYNRVEFSANETFYGNFALRIGVRSFYNILLIGGRIDGGRAATEPNRQLSLSWGLGYGFGTGITMGSRNNMMCLETVLIHVNEQQFWTRSLNLLNRYRLNFDFQTGPKTSIFFGPSMNIMFSKKFDEEALTYGSGIMPYSFYDKTRGQTNIKMWAGVGAGVRF